MKRLCSFLLACLLTISLAACGTVDTPPETTEITVTDQLGRTVTLEDCPQRIVSGYYISTSTLMALGVSDRLVAIEAKADQRPIYRLSAPELIDLPNVGSLKAFDLEGCLAQSPDLVILAAKQKDNLPSLDELGIPVVVVNPESREQIEEMITLLSEVTGTEQTGETLIEEMQTQEDWLADTLVDAACPSVYLAGNASLLSTAGDNMFQSNLIAEAGGTNVAGELSDTYWADISYEQLLAWNPDYIILASDAVYTVEDVMADPNLASCTAVQNGDVYQMPGETEAWDSPLPASVLGSLWLGSVLHGDVIDGSVWVDTAKAFYQTYYGFAYEKS